MSQDTLGYVELEWICPKCNSRNPGTEKVCQGCGAAQPQDVQFEQAAGAQVSQDAALQKTAESGADIHCAFCGTRNPPGAAECSQCGADLKEGTRREVGRVVGAYQTAAVKQVPCPNCGQANPETNLRCTRCGAPLTLERPAAPPAVAAPAAGKRSPLLVIGAIALALLVCICVAASFAWLSSPRESKAGQVRSVEWQTSVAIEELGPVQHRDWQNEIPQGAEVGACEDKPRFTQDQEPSSGNYNKVCGTPYTVDTGSGVGKVVQDCQYEVLEAYCVYTVEEWQVADQLTQRGADYQPVFPEPALASDQRMGDQSVTYVVIFDVDGQRYEYNVSSLEDFERFQVGSEWLLKLNAFGAIVEVEPR